MSGEEPPEITEQRDRIESRLEDLENLAYGEPDLDPEEVAQRVRGDINRIIDDLERTEQGFQEYDQRVRELTDEWIDRLDHTLEDIEDNYPVVIEYDSFIEGDININYNEMGDGITRRELGFGALAAIVGAVTGDWLNLAESDEDCGDELLGGRGHDIDLFGTYGEQRSCDENGPGTSPANGNGNGTGEPEIRRAEDISKDVFAQAYQNLDENSQREILTERQFEQLTNGDIDDTEITSVDVIYNPDADPYNSQVEMELEYPDGSTDTSRKSVEDDIAEMLYEEVR